MLPAMDQFEALDRAAEEAGRRVRQVQPDQWDLPTPCSDWTVRDLVNHLVRGNTMTVMLLDGASRDEVMEMFRNADPNEDLVAGYAETMVAQNAAFRGPGALDRTVHHPMGDIPATLLLQFRTGDATLHAWDLARAIGADEELDRELVELIYDGMLPMAPMLAGSGAFGEGPSGTVADDAPTQAKLLDLAGRRT
jgi:uncharacterized protein (TIGR03086 family)